MRAFKALNCCTDLILGPILNDSHQITEDHAHTACPQVIQGRNEEEQQEKQQKEQSE